jgi:hypothetical protein
MSLKFPEGLDPNQERRVVFALLDMMFDAEIEEKGADQMLREMGYDPDELVKEGQKFIDELKKKLEGKKNGSRQEAPQ